MLHFEGFCTPLTPSWLFPTHCLEAWAAQLQHYRFSEVFPAAGRKHPKTKFVSEASCRCFWRASCCSLKSESATGSCVMKHWMVLFFQKTQLVSIEWEIEILKWSLLRTLSLYRMETPASLRWGQTATSTPLYIECKIQTLKTHKPQISIESWGPGSPFPRGNSKGDIKILFKTNLEISTIF